MSRERYIEYYTSQRGGGSQHGGILIGGIMSGLGGIVKGIMRQMVMAPVLMMATRLMNKVADTQQLQEQPPEPPTEPAQGGSGWQHGACRGRSRKHC